MRRSAAAAFAVTVFGLSVHTAFALTDPSATTSTLSPGNSVVQGVDEQPVDASTDAPTDEQSGITTPSSVVSVSTVPSATTTIPIGCAPAPVSQAVFVGRVVTLDVTSAVFELVRLRSGSLAGYSTDVPAQSGQVTTQIGISYGRDVKFLKVGQAYLVGTSLDAATGRIFSRVTESSPLFGGNQVADINNSGVTCPTFADPARTLNVDGSAIESGVLSGLKGNSDRIALSVLIPAALVLLGLATVALVRRLILP